MLHETKFLHLRQAMILFWIMQGQIWLRTSLSILSDTGGFGF